jgi:hypothetical protein
MSKSDMTIKYEDLNFDEWIAPIINRAPKEHSKDFLFLGIDWDDPDNHSYMMEVAEFHQSRIGNPTTKEHLEKWVKDVQHLPEYQLSAIIKEYHIGKANE